MDVCVLGCTPGHIPRYMGQTSNNNKCSCYSIVCTWITIKWDKGIYMRVSLFGLFLRCTSLMGPWPKRIQSILLVFNFLFYDYYAIPVHTCSNLPAPEYFLLGIICYMHTCARPCFATWHCIILAWGVSLTPLDLTFRSWSLERGFSLLLIRVAQR